MDSEAQPLHRAISARDFALADRLIADGAALDDLIEEDGDSLLHRAAQDGDIETVEFFTRHSCPKTIETFDYVQQTPLIRAADHGQTRVVKALLSAGANPNARDELWNGNTAIREAVRGGHADIVSILLDAGADPAIPGWMAISAVDQAYMNIAGGPDSPAARNIMKPHLALAPKLGYGLGRRCRLSTSLSGSRKARRLSSA